MFKKIKLVLFDIVPIQMSMLLLSVILVSLPHFLRMPILLTLLSCLIIFWRILFEFHKLPIPNRVVRLVLLTFSLIVLFFNYTTLIGQNAGSAMLVIMLNLKLLELKSYRDAVVILYISFFVIVTGFLFQQGIFTAVYMLITVCILLTTMITWNHQLDKCKIQAGYLRHHFRVAFILLFQSLPLMLLLFFLFPRIPGPLWSMPDEGGAATGLSDTLEPGRFSQLSNNPDVAFRVKFNGATPLQQKLYWRGPVLSNYDGNRWRAIETNATPRLNIDDLIVSNPVDYTVTLEPHNQRWLFALDIPAIIPAQAKLTDNLQLLSSNLVRSVTQYKMRSYLNYKYDTQTIPNTALNLQLALSLPEGISPKTRTFISNLQQEHVSQKNLINAVLQHLRDQPFYYTRKPPRLYGDITDEFLFESRRGYCVHYASAFAVMMRMANIPARVISGYQGGEKNPLSDYLILRQSDAHAWVEVWFTGKGWVRVDPTSVIPDHRVLNTEDTFRRQSESSRNQFRLNQGFLSNSLLKLRFALDAVNNRWNIWIVGYDHKKQQSIFSTLGLDKLSLSTHTLYMTGIVLLLIFFSSLLVFKKKKQKMTAILSAYHLFCIKLARCGFEKQAQESASHFANRVIAQRGDLQSEIMPISLIYNQLRYAQTADSLLLSDFQHKIKQFQPSKYPSA